MSSSDTSPAPPPLYSDIPSERLKRSKRGPACRQHPWLGGVCRAASVGEPFLCAVRHATPGRNTDGGRELNVGMGVATHALAWL